MILKTLQRVPAECDGVAVGGDFCVPVPLVWLPGSLTVTDLSSCGSRFPAGEGAYFIRFVDVVGPVQISHNCGGVVTFIEDTCFQYPDGPLRIECLTNSYARIMVYRNQVPVFDNVFMIPVGSILYDSDRPAGITLKAAVKSFPFDNLIGYELVQVAAGDSIKAHKHLFSDACVVVTKGGGMCVLNGEDFIVTVGDVLEIPKNTRHSFVAGSDGLEFDSLQYPPIGNDYIFC